MRKNKEKTGSRGRLFSMSPKREAQKKRSVKRQREKRKRMNTPIPISPDAGAENNTKPPILSKKQKTLKNENGHEIGNNTLEEHLTNIQHDTIELMPTLMQEIEANSPTSGGRFKGIVTEKKLWKRFLHGYARFFGNISKSCDYCGISRNHVYRARERYPSLNSLMNIVEDRFTDEVEEVMKRHSLLPNSVVERFFILKAKRKEVYGDGGDKQPVAVEISFKHLGALRDAQPKEVTNDN